MPGPAKPKDTQRRRSGGVTVKDVAEHAGVGVMTVSRAIRSPESVSKKLRTRVEKAIEALGYVPNRFAGGLASVSSRIVTIIIPSLSNRVFTDIVRGADDVLGPAGYQILLSNTYYSLEQEEAICRTVLGWRPEGLIIAGVDHTEGTRSLLSSIDIPVVEAMEIGANPIDINIGLSHHDAGRQITRHLVEAGYRKIAFIGAQLDVDYRAARRFAGHRQALEESGLSSFHQAVSEAPSSYRTGSETLGRMLDEGISPDAVFCVNDELAVGAIFECQRRGLRIPGDIAIAGFNGLEIGADVVPTLTTVLSPRRKMGQLSAQAILDRLEGENEAAVHIDVGFEILRREST